MASRPITSLKININMNIGAEEKKHIARLLSFLLCGEKVAHRCSVNQAKLCTDDQIKHFLIKQSRQERFHAVTFQSAILLLAPKGVSTPAKNQMQQYETLLNNATNNHDLYTSVVGLQVIFEGMGDVVLSHFDHGIKQRGLGFKKIRRAILSQEDSHHEFGLNYVKKNILPVAPSIHADDYLSLINEMLTSLQGLFDFFDEDSRCYVAEFNHNLPEQIHKNALGHHSNT